MGSHIRIFRPTNFAFRLAGNNSSPGGGGSIRITLDSGLLLVNSSLLIRMFGAVCFEDILILILFRGTTIGVASSSSTLPSIEDTT